MSYPTPWQGPPPAGSGAPSMLASHADRERAVDVLRAGYGEGRLGHPEFEKRVARAYSARTVGELSLLVADLPQGPMTQPMTPHGQVPPTFLPPPQARTNGKALASMVCGVLCVATAGLTGLPAVILGHMAQSEIRRTGEAGDGMALTGLVLGWLSVAGWLVFLGLFGLLAVVATSA
ncbi:DUF1707 and DUF4190 domain-containing protein [Streptomyces cellulosae]|uniref:DUF1707 and DUF4190 domain-containing protein n=1 Tax=Streptomyces cellulosae TaxID=1968 RepID=UPI002255C8EE|nr:DUF1707 and DUF4190 domain-containing protein [Streptomyces cellulosae]WSB55842.1 DUF1707 and DUF4190 domain-containing protein [Streptomyces cellulosae]WTB70901.1 DUF1707 and DUF4190 domain-containing protein [Streptomyces cellulosae]WTB82322.1 DUF1707 and DUF4190 domain-containing protein [Streptomyces cellulosae]WTC56496.1 DUF1707 and DUF4190 domain-containing protein [Streptomyces cellulosae]